MICGHYSAMLHFYGAELGNRVGRKHLGWYLDDAGTGVEMRKRVLTCRDGDEVLRLIPEALADRERVAA